MRGAVNPLKEDASINAYKRLRQRGKGRFRNTLLIKSIHVKKQADYIAGLFGFDAAGGGDPPRAFGGVASSKRFSKPGPRAILTGLAARRGTRPENAANPETAFEILAQTHALHAMAAPTLDKSAFRNLLLLWPLRQRRYRKQRTWGRALSFVSVAQLLAYLVVGCCAIFIRLGHFYYWFIFLIELNISFTIAGLVAWRRDERPSR